MYRKIFSVKDFNEKFKNRSVVKSYDSFFKILTYFQVVANFADKFVVIADYRKNSVKLGTSYKFIPVEVLPLAYKPITLEIEKKFGGKVQLRMAKAKAGPVVTDNGNLLLDWYFDASVVPSEESMKSYWTGVNSSLMCTPGVVDTGLFVDFAKMAYFGMEDGTVKTVSV